MKLYCSGTMIGKQVENSCIKNVKTTFIFARTRPLFGCSPLSFIASCGRLWSFIILWVALPKERKCIDKHLNVLYVANSTTLMGPFHRPTVQAQVLNIRPKFGIQWKFIEVFVTQVPNTYALVICLDNTFVYFDNKAFVYIKPFIL